MMSVVSEHPAPMLRAGPLEPVLIGLLTKDPEARTSAEAAREQLTAVLAGAPPGPLPPAAGRPPAGARLAARRVRGADRLRRPAGAGVRVRCPAPLGRARRPRPGASPEGAPPGAQGQRARPARAGSRPSRRAPPRRRFKRRWVVVPVLVTLAVVLLVLVGIGFLVASACAVG